MITLLSEWANVYNIPRLYLNQKVTDKFSICLEIFESMQEYRKINLLDINFVAYTAGLNVGETRIK